MTFNQHFGFTEDPFALMPDPRFLFMSKAHEEAMAHLTYGISQNRGFIMITGEAGTGKTTLISHVLENTELNTRAALISEPVLDALELLKSVNLAFGLEVKVKVTHKSLMDDLNTFLLECHNDGERTLLVIDDAHKLSRECLEFVRLLSNLETDTNKLLQVAIVGRSKLGDTIKQESLRQLNQRIAVRYVLGRLSVEETGKYLSHRLHVAGAFGLSFPTNCIDLIHRFSDGVPSLINISASKILVDTYSKGSLKIETKTVRRALEAIRDEGYGDVNVVRKKAALRMALIILILAATIGIAINIPGFIDRILGIFGFGSMP